MPMDPLMAVIDQDGYEYLSVQHPDYLLAIEKELKAGSSPDEIRRKVMRLAGSDRLALAKRCEQAARYVARMTGEAA